MNKQTNIYQKARDSEEGSMQSECKHRVSLEDIIMHLGTFLRTPFVREREAIPPPNKRKMETKVLKPGALQFILIKQREVFSPGADPADGSLVEPAGTPFPPTSGEPGPSCTLPAMSLCRIHLGILKPRE